MLKVCWDFERVFAGVYAGRKVRLLLKGPRRALLRAIKFSHMGIAGRYVRTNIEWHGLRLFKGRDGLMVAPGDKMSDTRHDPIPWWIEIWINALCSSEPCQAFFGLSEKGEQVTHVSDVLGITGIHLQGTLVVLHRQVMCTTKQIDVTEDGLTEALILIELHGSPCMFKGTVEYLI